MERGSHNQRFYFDPGVGYRIRIVSFAETVGPYAVIDLGFDLKFGDGRQTRACSAAFTP